MTNPATIDLANPLEPARCQAWLDQAYRTTTNPGVHRLIDELTIELQSLGPIEAELESVVLGALESVAAAIDTDEMLTRLN